MLKSKISRVVGELRYGGGSPPYPLYRNSYSCNREGEGGRAAPATVESGFLEGFLN